MIFAAMRSFTFLIVRYMLNYIGHTNFYNFYTYNLVWHQNGKFYFYNTMRLLKNKPNLIWQLNIKCYRVSLFCCADILYKN
jgi:hypothetical protein